MDFEFFENLSRSEAQQYLTRYIELEAGEIERLASTARCDGVLLDYSIGSLAPFFLWLGPRTALVRVEPDADVPEWIRVSMEEHGGFLDFDDESRLLVLRASYYLGESFVRTFPDLTWALGRADRAEANQPVVTGFVTGVDLPPLMVAENLLLDSKSDDFPRIVATAVSAWTEAVA